MEGFQVLILIGRLFYHENSSNYDRDFKDEKEFLKKAEIESEYLTFSSTIFVIKEHRHYKHSDNEVRGLGIVKIG